MPEKVFVSLPYGNWNNSDSDFVNIEKEQDYYFAGGYSNRDYERLINIWNNSGIKGKLVIIGSKNNIDLIKYESGVHSENVKVLTDTSSEEFDKYLLGAKACIFPFKENTGASGQSVTLRCMRLNKLIISDDTDIMREYVINGKTGVLLKDMGKELSEVLHNIDNGNINKEELIKESYNLFKTKFSYKTITQKLKSIII